MSARPTVSVHLLPELIPEGSLVGGLAIVIDVLRATTTMVHALASGCEAIIPCLEIDEARQVAASLPPGSSVLGGERQGLPIEGFDLGNSPGSYTPEVCRGKTLVMTTTNGTRAILNSLDAGRILVASFANATATLRAAEAADRRIHLVCAGTDGRISLEDSLLAGYIADRLMVDGYHAGNDETLLMASTWRDCDAEIETETLADRIRQGRGGQRVSQIGLAADIADAAALDRFDFVAELRREPLRIIRVNDEA